MKTEHYIMEDGLKAKVYDYTTLHEFFRRKFPDGITMQMPDVALVDLKKYDELKVSDGDFTWLPLTEFWGVINNTQDRLYYPGEGILQAEMRFKPDEYHLLMAEDSYANRDDNMSCEDDMSLDTRSSTTFAHLHGQDTNDMTVEVTIGVDSLRCLYIEGRPFSEVMKAVHKTGCTDETELKQLLTLMNIRDKGLQGKSVPEIVEPLLRENMPDYDSLLQDTPNVREQKIIMAAEYLVTRTRAMEQKPFCLTATFDPSDGNRAAREVVDTVNRISAEEPVEKHFAVAFREGNRVDISVNAWHPELPKKVEQLVRANPKCLSFEYKPYQAILNDNTYLVLASGQAVKGRLNRENLHRGYEYSIVPTGVEGNIQDRMIRNEPGNAELYTLFTSTEPIRFQEGLSDDRIHVEHLLTAQQFLDSALLDDIKFMECKDDPQKVYINARTRNANLTGVRLNPRDTMIYQRAKAAGDEDSMNIIKHTFASVYYKEAIAMERERVEEINRPIRERYERKEAMLARVTEPELYGKVDDIHIRCVIDGKPQEGRPLKGYNLTVSNLKHYAALDEKNFLNYQAWFHESNIREMAANVFQDVLTGKVEQQQRTRGMKL